MKWFTTDLAGNAEAVQSQQIVVLDPRVVVSLTFDDGLLTQYALGDKLALKPHGLRGTFFDITGLHNDEQHMTWEQLTDLNNDGNEIGAHTVNHVSLKGCRSDQATSEACGSYNDLVAHGFYPTSFAYPTGAYDAQAESVVQSCGFTSGRAAGGIDVAGEGLGPVYAESLPPKDPFALRTLYDQPDVHGGVSNVPPLTLAHLEAAVNGASSHGGGWVPLVFHEICSQQYDPDNYTFCINDWGPIELTTLNQFFDWLKNSGQPGGAPVRTVVETVSEVMNGPDTQAPITELDCNGSPCATSSYPGSVTVKFAAKDPGGTGVKATYYTTDGSAPTTSSPQAGLPFTINSNTTFTFFSVDNNGNTEAVQTLTVHVAPRTDPIVGAAGDIACDPDQTQAFFDAQGTATDCRAIHTAQLLEGVDAVLPLGDDQYSCGGAAAWAQSYDPTWGQLKSITHPVPGDADYATSGGTDCPSTPGAAYYQYFGAAAGDPAKGYYSYDIGQWHVVAINTAPCGTSSATCDAGSAQETWLRQDLAANSSSCTLAYYQNPRFTSSPGGGADYTQPIWQDLYDGGVEIVLNGDSHWYERFAPLNAAGQPDASFGVREFIVGTGGQGLETPVAADRLSTSQVIDGSTHGVIKLTLHNGSYDWTFVPDEGTFTDSGTASCHPKPTPPDTTPPTTTVACNGATCAPAYTSSVQVSLAATDNTGGSGVKATYYTTDGSTPTTSSTQYTGPFTVLATSTVSYLSVDNANNAETPKSQLITVDATAPTTTVSCNGAACSAGTYAGAVQVSLTATDNVGGSGVKGTYYTTDGSTPTTASTPYIAPFTVAATSTVKYFSVDNAGNAEGPKSQLITVDAAAPTTTVSCNGAACAAGFYAINVQVSLAATDNAGGSGVAATYYTTNGSTPTTSSTVYTGPFTVASTTTVKYFSVDNAGNAETPKSQQIQIDKTPPTTTALCNAAACAAWYKAGVQVTLPATDPGGSGVAATYYTVNGTTPTTASTRYTGQFSITATTTVQFFSVDVAGNAEAVKSQLIQIDTVAPTTAIACNGTTCASGWYTAAVSVTLSATDNAGGSGVAGIYYTTNGTTPTTSSTRYTGAFSLTQTAAVKYFAVDVAGNAAAIKTQNVQVDVAAPVTTITCSAAACSTGWYRASVTVRLAATDPSGGGGVAATYYTTDGTTPTTSSTRYTGSFSIAATRTVKYFSVDVAGNKEAVKSQTIMVDTAAPTTTLRCNGGTCASSYSSAVTVTLVATDPAGGSGVSSTHYTTNGSQPTLSSPTYTGAFSVRVTTTVRFRSWDVAGNVESAQSQKITIR